MKMTRGQAIGYHSALSVISQGQKVVDGRPVAPDITPKTYMLLVIMLNCLTPVREAFDKVSAARFQFFAGEKPERDEKGQPRITDPSNILAYNAEMSDLLSEEINVRMPKDRIPEAELKAKENGIHAGLMAQITPLMKLSTEFEMEDE